MKAEITFKNAVSEKQEQEARRILESVAEDFEIYSMNPEVFAEGDDEQPPFHEYGLSFEANDGYKTLLIAWGGPSYEVRFHDDGTIEFVYLDWFVGIGFDVTEWPQFQWVKEQFEEFEML